MNDIVERASELLTFVGDWHVDMDDGCDGRWHVVDEEGNWIASLPDPVDAALVAAAPALLREFVAEVKTSRQSALEWSRVCRENCRAVVDAEAERDDALAEVRRLRAQVERMRTCR